MNLRLTKSPNGFIPADETTMEAFKRYKLGAVLHGEFRQERNYKYHKKWFALATIAFDAWCELGRKMEYKGQEVLEDFDRFRRDLVILAGFYKAVYNIKGEVRLEAESLSFGSMSQERFDQLFDKTITAILHKVLPKGRFTELELRTLTETVLEFA